MYGYLFKKNGPQTPKGGFNIPPAVKASFGGVGVVLTAILLFTCTTIQAQQSRRLTIEDAIDLGMKYSKQLKLDKTKISGADVKYKQFLTQLAPNAAINSSIMHNSENLPFYQDVVQFGGITFPATAYNYYINSLNVSQIVFAGLRGWNTLAAYKDQTKASQYDLAAEKLITKNNIITAYYNLYKLTESKKVVEENIKVLTTRLKDAQNLQSTGMALKNDVLKVQLSISNLKQSEDEVQSAIDVSNYNLAIMLGLTDSVKIEIAEEGLITAKSDYNLNTGLQNALRRRPEIKAANVRLGISHKMLKVANGLYFPVVSGIFNFNYDEPNPREFLGNVEFKYSWEIGVKLSWNLTGLATNQFQTQEAKINMSEAELQQEQLSDNIKMEVNSNYAAYKLALDKINLNLESISQARENRRMTKDQYDNGIKNITDMLEADNLVTVSEINLLSAKIDAEIAYAKLIKSTSE